MADGEEEERERESGGVPMTLVFPGKLQLVHGYCIHIGY